MTRRDFVFHLVRHSKFN